MLALSLMLLLRRRLLLPRRLLLLLLLLQLLASHRCARTPDAPHWDRRQYMREDLAIFNWTLTLAEMKGLDAGTFANETTVKDMCTM